MKKKVGRVEAKLIMMAAREFRERERLASVSIDIEQVALLPEPTVPEISPVVEEPIVVPKKPFYSCIVGWFGRKGA